VTPDSLTEQRDIVSQLRILVIKLRALAHGPSLDADLAMGIRPSASAEHLARADLITRPWTRRRIQAALNTAIERAAAPRRRVTAEAPVSANAILECRDQLIMLANAVVAAENPRVQGIAIARQLAFDGRGALFFQPKNRKRAVERLKNTIEAALRALSVSSEFDFTSPREMLA
jgi:hypothetical protein